LQIRTIDSMLVGKHRDHTADPPTKTDLEVLFHTRRLLMQGIAVPENAADSSPSRATPATDVFISMAAVASLDWGLSQWCGQQSASGTPTRLTATKAAGEAGASSPLLDAGSAIDAILHDATRPYRPSRSRPHPLGDTGPPGATAGPPVKGLPWSMDSDPFHGDWPHW
jgi:hypothetical protein